MGSIGIANALDTILECAQANSCNHRVHYLFVGDSDLKLAYMNQYGHLPNVTFAPKLPKPMVQSLLSFCDVAYFSVHDSEVWRYGQSLNKVLDYMLSGRPIIASYSGFPSMVNEAQCGSFVAACNVPALSSIIDYYSNMPTDTLDEIGARGREWILKHRKYSVLAEDYLHIMGE